MKNVVAVVLAVRCKGCGRPIEKGRIAFHCLDCASQRKGGPAKINGGQRRRKARQTVVHA